MDDYGYTTRPTAGRVLTVAAWISLAVIVAGPAALLIIGARS